VKIMVVANADIADNFVQMEIMICVMDVDAVGTMFIVAKLSAAKEMASIRIGRLL